MRAPHWPAQLRERDLWAMVLYVALMLLMPFFTLGLTAIFRWLQ